MANLQTLVAFIETAASSDDLLALQAAMETARKRLNVEASNGRSERWAYGQVVKFVLKGKPAHGVIVQGGRTFGIAVWVPDQNMFTYYKIPVSELVAVPGSPRISLEHHGRSRYVGDAGIKQMEAFMASISGPQSSGRAEASSFTQGQSVLAKWTDGEYYPGKVGLTRNGKVQILWADGSPALWVILSDVRRAGRR